MINVNSNAGPGQIILLEGASSTGKSSTASAIQEVFEDPYLLMGADQFLGHVMPRRYWIDEPCCEDGLNAVVVPDRDPAEREVIWGPFGKRLWYGLNACIAALSRIGHNVVADYAFLDDDLIRNAVDEFAGLPVLICHLHCPLELSIARKAQRGGRTGDPDMVAVWRWWHRIETEQTLPHDLSFDSSKLSPEECAQLIEEHLREGRPQHAFLQLAERQAWIAGVE